MHSEGVGDGLVHRLDIDGRNRKAGFSKTWEARYTPDLSSMINEDSLYKWHTVSAHTLAQDSEGQHVHILCRV